LRLRLAVAVLRRVLAGLAVLPLLGAVLRLLAAGVVAWLRLLLLWMLPRLPLALSTLPLAGIVLLDTGFAAAAPAVAAIPFVALRVGQRAEAQRGRGDGANESG